MRHVGLDFGTTNSAVSLLDGDGLRLARYGAMDLYRSVLYFDAEQVDGEAPLKPLSGPEAIHEYFEADDSGRFIQSTKTWLGSRLFSFTTIARKPWYLEDLVGAVLRNLRAAAQSDLGRLDARPVVGRPVNFTAKPDPAANELGIERMGKALSMAGWGEPVFVPEPVAAAYHYERRLDEDELVLIGDFGGGTSDFCALRVGPSFRDRDHEILGTAGVAVAGNAFDSRIVQALVAPHVGLGSNYRTEFGRVLEIPASVFKLRWHELSVLRTPDTLRALREYHRSALEPEKIQRYLDLLEEDLAYRLYRAVESMKIQLSSAPKAEFEFMDIRQTVHRTDLESWIDPEVRRIEACLDGFLDTVGLGADEVDRVFLTGGSSFIPAVRGLFVERFGADSIRAGEELTSVASGLALIARDKGF
jgi:hypothetical chaperone protein